MHECCVAIVSGSFVAQVTFKSVLFIPEKSPSDMFNNYGKNMEFIKMYVRRVFITDDFKDMMPKYLSFVRGVVSAYWFSGFSSCPPPLWLRLGEELVEVHAERGGGEIGVGKKHRRDLVKHYRTRTSITSVTQNETTWFGTSFRC